MTKGKARIEACQTGGVNKTVFEYFVDAVWPDRFGKFTSKNLRVFKTLEEAQEYLKSPDCTEQIAYYSERE